MLKATISRYRIERGRSAREVMEMSGLSQGDYYNKMKHPERLRIIDLQRIQKAAGIPQEDMLQEVSQLLLTAK
jgi:predicted alpha-1,6-mannanase (GH76 family)